MSRISQLALFTTAFGLIASSAAAQLLPLPAPPRDTLPPPANHSSWAPQKYYPTETYAGSLCKSMEGYESGNFDYYGGYYNNSRDGVDVICPLVNHNDPYQKWIWSNVTVSDQSWDYNVSCEFKKATPAYGGWGEYSSGKVWSSGSKLDPQQLKLKPVPGGYTPDSHLFVQCYVPDYSFIGNYSQYTGEYKSYARGYDVYDYGYMDSIEWQAGRYGKDSYDGYKGRRY